MPANHPAPHPRDIKFYGSQVGGEVVVPLTYTGSPVQLLGADIKSFFSHIRFLPFIVLPLQPCPSGHLDELYPSIANLWEMFLHLILFIVQAIFLLSIPAWFLFPVWMVVSFVTVFIISNTTFCIILNGLKSHYTSDPGLIDPLTKHEHEQWIFLNGVAVGRHWLTSNINRIALTFGRPVLGVHNKTSGIIFDVIECLIQRNFDYATTDVRDCYVVIKHALYSPVKKVVFILHSQGGIEGGMIIDWLLQEVPQDLLAKLEVYTFGNAANHFNNPHRHLKSQTAAQNAAKAMTKNPWDTRAVSKSGHEIGNFDHKAIRYIEHYANKEDFVAKWGILNVLNKQTSLFAPRFMGRVFEREGRGHQFCQHYLDNMFPLNASRQRASNRSSFMESLVIPDNLEHEHREWREGLEQSYFGTDPGRRARQDVVVRDVDSPVTPMTINWPESSIDDDRNPRRLKVKDLSRLWLYRNGGSPPDDEPSSDDDENENENGNLQRVSTL